MARLWIDLCVAAAATSLLQSHCLAQQWPDSLSHFDQLLKSDAAQERHVSREALAAEISKIPEESRSAAIASLIEAFPKQPYRIQLGIAVALSKQPKPWDANNLERQTKTLYQVSQETLDPTLKRTIDDALANAKGGYRDAIIDFSSDRIGDIAGVTDKFGRIPEDFPKSRYVPNAVFYHGQYLTRAYLLGHSQGRQLVEESNSVLDRFIKNPDLAQSRLAPDANYNLALNHMLLGNRDRAMEVLSTMEKTFSNSDDVYVYQPFFSKDRNTVVDKSFPAPLLAKKTREFIEANKTLSPSDQARLIDYITN